ncbi:MAG: hypothetical protein Q9157_007057 [Trypethelium eluteriae]
MRKVAANGSSEILKGQKKVLPYPNVTAPGPATDIPLGRSDTRTCKLGRAAVNRQPLPLLANYGRFDLLRKSQEKLPVFRGEGNHTRLYNIRAVLSPYGSLSTDGVTLSASATRVEIGTWRSAWTNNNGTGLEEMELV